jgi:hypothetical protein
VRVKPGETTVTNFGGTGRTITGKVTVTGDTAPDFTNNMGLISTPAFKLMEQARQLKTDAERKAFYESPEYQKAEENRRGYSVAIRADGSFSAEDVVPGKYEFNLMPKVPPFEKTHTLTMFNSVQEFIVPDAKDEKDDSSVDMGTVEVKKFAVKIPEPEKNGK